MSRTKKAGALLAALAPWRWWRFRRGGRARPSSRSDARRHGYQGKVKAANSNCVGERTVVLKQKGNGVLSRVKSKANGNWKPTSKSSTQDPGQSTPK